MNAEKPRLIERVVCEFRDTAPALPLTPIIRLVQFEFCDNHKNRWHASGVQAASVTSSADKSDPRNYIAFRLGEYGWN